MRTSDFCHYKNASSWFIIVMLLTATHFAKSHLGATLSATNSKYNIEWIRKLFLDDDDNNKEHNNQKSQHARDGFDHVGKKIKGHTVLQEIASWNRHRHEQQQQQQHDTSNDGQNYTTAGQRRRKKDESAAIDIRAIRITSDGDIYVQYNSRRRTGVTRIRQKDDTVPDTTTSLDHVTPFRGILHENNEQQQQQQQDDDNDAEQGRRAGAGGGGQQRELVVVGQDQRSRITDTQAWPYRLVGELQSKPDASGNYETCSATIISATSILTSAHCVYNVSDGTFMNVEGFAPAKSGDVDPYGLWEYSSVTIYSSYALGLGDDGDYDIAIVTLKPRPSDDGMGIGDIVGMAGIRKTQSRRSPKLQACTVTGYPLDKPPHEMWTSGSCIGSYTPFDESYFGVQYECDTFSGNSGSALMDNDGYVYGVHWGGTSTFNVGTTLRGNRYQDILQWSGRLNFQDETAPNKLETDSIRS